MVGDDANLRAIAWMIAQP